MARSDCIKTKPFGSFKEEIEFDYPIAFNARIGCQSGGMIFDEGLDYGSLKLRCVVKNVMVNVKCVSDASGVVYIRN